MSKLTVLVTTMHQSDMRKYSEMNLQTDAVIANQTDRDALDTQVIDGCRVQLVSTATRGTSRNRNIALAHADQAAEYLMFADDDLVFESGYEEKILAEFEAHPEAEAIKFNVHDLSNERKLSMRRIEKFEKATRRNMSASGVFALVFRSHVLKKLSLHFNEAFGPGTEDYCGEDTIFLMALLDKKAKVYRSPVDIAGIDQTESSWCTGIDEKFFFVKGKVLKMIYPRLARLLAIRSAFRFSRKKACPMKFGKILKCYLKGIKAK